MTDARSGGADISEAAQKSGMKIGHLAAVDANGLKPDGSKADVPADPEFLPTLFKTEMGEDSDPFPAKSGRLFRRHVDGVTPPKLKPLDQVRAQAIAAWTDEQRGRLLAAKALALTAEAEKDKSLDNVAKDMKVTVQHSPALTRQTNDTMFNATLCAAPVRCRARCGGIAAHKALGATTSWPGSPASPIPGFDPRDSAFQAGRRSCRRRLRTISPSTWPMPRANTRA